MQNPTISLPKSGCKILWQDWEDSYIVYQPSSGETHVFNETTALILKRLESGPASLEEIREWAAESLDIEISEIAEDGLSSVAGRLDELGLVDWLDETPAHP